MKRKGFSLHALLFIIFFNIFVGFQHVSCQAAQSLSWEEKRQIIQKLESMPEVYGEKGVYLSRTIIPDNFDYKEIKNGIEFSYKSLVFLMVIHRYPDDAKVKETFSAGSASADKDGADVRKRVIQDLSKIGKISLAMNKNMTHYGMFYNRIILRHKENNVLESTIDFHDDKQIYVLFVKADTGQSSGKDFIYFNEKCNIAINNYILYTASENASPLEIIIDFLDMTGMGEKLLKNVIKAYRNK